MLARNVRNGPGETERSIAYINCLSTSSVSIDLADLSLERTDIDARQIPATLLSDLSQSRLHLIRMSFDVFPRFPRYVRVRLQIIHHLLNSLCRCHDLPPS